MSQVLKEQYQVGSLRVRVSPEGGIEWQVASNSNAPYMQQMMRRATVGKEPGLYIPNVEVGKNAHL